MKYWKLALGIAALLTATSFAPLPLGGISSNVINVTQFATFQAAIDATPTGGTLLVPVGHYTSSTRPAVVQMTITRPIYMVGEGTWHEADPAAGGSIIEWNQDNDLIFINGGSGLTSGSADGTVIDNLFLIGSNTSSGKGRGILARNVHHLTIRNTQFYHFSRAAFEDSLSSGQFTVFPLFERCSFMRTSTGNLLNLGIEGSGATHAVIRNCHFINNSAQSLFLGLCTGTVVETSVFENDVDGPSATGKDGAYILWEGGNGLKIRDNWFERTAATNPPNSWMIYINGQRRQCEIEGNFFTRTSSQVDRLRAIKFADSGTGPFITRIANNLGTIHDTTTGLDDVVLSGSSWVQMENNILTDAINTDRRWMVSGTDHYANLMRVNEARRTRLQGANGDSIIAWTDIDNGEMAYDSTDKAIVFRQASSWRKPIMTLSSAGPPQTGHFNIGDMGYSTGGDTLFICTVAGTAPSVTWKSVKAQ